MNPLSKVIKLENSGIFFIMNIEREIFCLWVQNINLVVLNKI